MQMVLHINLHMLTCITYRMSDLRLAQQLQCPCHSQQFFACTIKYALPVVSSVAQTEYCVTHATTEGVPCPIHIAQLYAHHFMQAD